MAYTAQQIATGASTVDGVGHQLAAIIFLLNVNGLTAQQLATGASTYDGVTDKMGAIIYLLANYVTSGAGAPSASTTGQFYVNTSNANLYAYIGGAWVQVGNF